MDSGTTEPITETGNMRGVAALIMSTCLLCYEVSAETFFVDIWADNWFQFSVGGEPIAEDPVPITTERSFNSERFSFDATHHNGRRWSYCAG